MFRAFLSALLDSKDLVAVYPPHQNLRCFGIKVLRFYCDLTPMSQALQIYCNPWPGGEPMHSRRGRRQWFYPRWTRPLSWALSYSPGSY